MSEQKSVVGAEATVDLEQASAVESEESSAADTDAPKILRQRRFRGRRLMVAIAVGLLIVTAAAAALWQYVAQYRPDVATDAQVANTVIAAAEDGTVAILSYSPETLQRDFATAKPHLTGDFLAYYNEFTEQVVRPAATDKKVKTTAEVTRAAIDELHPNSAKVLVYINQATTSTDKPDPAMTTSSVVVTLQNQGGAWLISAFDPV